MTDQKPKAAQAAAINLETADFKQLKQEFNDCSCEANAFATAAWMVRRFPQESKDLLPRIKGEQLAYDGKAEPVGTNYEWAAALTAAKALKDTKKLEFSNIEEAAISKEASRIYIDAAKDDRSCKPPKQR